MPIIHLHSYFIHLGKGLKEAPRPPIHGATLTVNGKLVTLIKRVYGQSHDDWKPSIKL